jgi:hypothetical protein
LSESPKIQSGRRKNRVFTLFTPRGTIIKLAGKESRCKFIGRWQRRVIGVRFEVVPDFPGFNDSLSEFIKLLAKDPLKVPHAKTLPP